MRRKSLTCDLVDFNRSHARIWKVLGNADRVAIVDLLQKSEQPISELLDRLHIQNKVNLIRNLTALENAGIVESHKVGPQTLYRVAFVEVGSALSQIRDALVLRSHQNAKMRNCSSAIE